MRRSRFPMKRQPSIPVRDLAARHIVTDARTAGSKQRGSEASRLLLVHSGSQRPATTTAAAHLGEAACRALRSAPGRARVLADPSIAAGQTEVLPSDLISRYRSVRGSPNCGRMLLSANQVMADIWSPSMVRTNSPNARATPVSGTGR